MPSTRRWPGCKGRGHPGCWYLYSCRLPLLPLPSSRPACYDGQRPAPTVSSPGVGGCSDPDIFFDDDVIDVCAFHLFYPGLGQGIVAELNGECKGFTLPVPVGVKVQVLGVLIAGQGIAAAAGIEMVGRILRRVDVVCFRKAKCESLMILMNSDPVGYITVSFFVIVIPEMSCQVPFSRRPESALCMVQACSRIRKAGMARMRAAFDFMGMNVQFCAENRIFHS